MVAPLDAGAEDAARDHDLDRQETTRYHVFHLWHYLYMARAKVSAHGDRAVVAVGDRGRIVLPARLRRSLGLEPGDQLLAEVDSDHTLRLVPRQVWARRHRGAFADLRTDDSLVDQLISDRRDEVAQEGS